MASRRGLPVFMAEVALAIADATVWSLRQITVRRVGIGLAAAATIGIVIFALIWLAAAVLGSFMSPSGCAWILGVGPCS